MNKFSRLGFILAAAGSAVGLGNIWKFPYVTGEYGGGAFVIIYLLAIALIGLTVFIAESYIGQRTGANVATAFQETSKTKNPKWQFMAFTVFAALLILSFYSVVLGWILNYIIISFDALPSDVKTASDTFTNLVTKEIGLQVLFHTIIALTIVFIVLKGIKEGIEKLNFVLMPMLALILFGLLLYSLTLDGFGKAVEFMFVPDWSKISSEALLASLGQAFFTLSLGMGTIMTYAASMTKDTNFVKSSLMVAIVDTSVALIAGLIIFSFLFEAGAKSAAGPGLVFISLPLIFSEWGVLGQVIAISFFVALVFAGITSAVSLIEPGLRFLIEKFNMTRAKATIICGTFFYLMGILALLSMSSEHGSSLTFFGKNLFDWLDYLTANVAMPVAGFLTCIFLGYFVEKSTIEEKFLQFTSKGVFEFWYFLVRYIVPIATIVLFLNLIGVI